MIFIPVFIYFPRRNIVSTAVHAQRAAALRMLKIYGRKGGLRLPARRTPVESTKTAAPSYLKQTRMLGDSEQVPYDMLSITGQHYEHQVQHRLKPSQYAPAVQTTKNAFLAKLQTHHNNYHQMRVEQIQLPKYSSPSTSTESSLVIHKHKRRRRKTSHAHKRKRVVNRKSPQTPPPYVDAARGTKATDLAQKLTPFGKGLQEWQMWRISLNEHLASHLLSKKKHDAKALPVGSIMETMDQKSLKAVMSVAYGRDIPVTSLSQIAYVVYGIPRVHIKKEWGTLKQPLSPSRGTPQVQHTRTLGKGKSRHAFQHQHEQTVTTMVSNTCSSLDSTDYFDPHYDLLKIYREHKRREEVRARVRARQQRGWVPSKEELAVARANLTPVTTPCDSPDGGSMSHSPPSKGEHTTCTKSYISRLNFTDITDECESPMYCSFNGHSTSTKYSDYNNAPIYRPTTALIRSIRKYPVKAGPKRTSPLSSTEEHSKTDDSIYLFRPQMAPGGSEQIPQPYRQEDDNFSLFPHKENQRAPYRTSPSHVPTMYRPVYGDYEHYQHRVLKNNAWYE